MEDFKTKKRLRDETVNLPEAEIDSPEVKRLRENLLEDDEADCCAGGEDLDLYVKSFEEEIRNSPEPVDLNSDSGEAQPVLGYLLEATDDELGLPPTTSSSPEGSDEVVPAESELGGEFWGFDGELSGYAALGFGVGEAVDGGSELAFDGLFEFSDFGSGDFAWRSETLPAQ